MYININFLTFYFASVKTAPDFLSKYPAGNLSSQMVFSLTSWQVLHTKFFLATGPQGATSFFCSFRFQLHGNLVLPNCLRLSVEISWTVQRLKDF